jgi:hypothetical protein
MLGLFWANLVPIFIAYAITNRSKAILWWVATVACVLIVIATASSTPIATLFLILLLLPLFPLRCFGKEVILGVFGITLTLHAIMEQPIWHLIGRIRIIPGSTGFHRVRLINAAIKHFDEWAFLGTRATGHWGFGLNDITNNYIRQGLDGGLITLVLFVVILIIAIWACGKYSLLNVSKTKQWLGWAFCVSVMGHCISFQGVSYFGKIHMILYLTFATVGMIYEMLLSEFQKCERLSAVCPNSV